MVFTFRGVVVLRREMPHSISASEDECRPTDTRAPPFLLSGEHSLFSNTSTTVFFALFSSPFMNWSSVSERRPSHGSFLECYWDLRIILLTFFSSIYSERHLIQWYKFLAVGNFLHWTFRIVITNETSLMTSRSFRNLDIKIWTLAGSRAIDHYCLLLFLWNNVKLIALSIVLPFSV